MLDINLKPIFVNITNKNKTISADKRYSIECVASGSRPEAVITWWKGSKQIKKLAKNFSKPGDTTVSILTLEPTMEDDGKNLTCRAENPIITNSALEDKWQLHVHYMPVVTLKMGSTLNPNDIKEGDDVYFECNVRANPKAHRLVWYHDGEEIHHNVSDGTILSDRSLVLQGVSRRSAGQYTCMAANSEGKGKSDPVQLQVMYAPVCLSELDELVGAVREETVQLRCEVDANPASVLFTWTFNNSGDLVQLPPHKYTTGTNAGTVSRLNYTPVSDMDYGTLSCWGRNSVGTQALPCLFQVVAAGRPLPLVNCSVSNLTVSYLRVECEESFDGGLPQSFLMEVLKLPSLELQFNVSSPRPQFDWHGADLFSSYRILLFSYNSKGRSEPVILEAVALKGVAKFTGSRGLHISSVLAGFATVCLALVVVACALLVAAYRKRKMEHGSQVKLEPVNTSCPGVLLIPNNSCQEHKSADDNPDIIPNQYEKRPLKSFMKIYKTPPQKRKKKDQECVEQTKAVDENYSNFSHSVIVTSKSNQFTNYVFNSNSSSKLNRLGSPVSPGDISNVGSFRSSSSQKLGPEVVTATHRLQESCI
nr:PREDICTED: hemicentin-2 [Bemisia tabaci]